MKEKAFLGKGVALAFDIDQKGSLKTASGAELIRESLFIILSTKIGERIERSDFGCRIHELMFAQNDTFTRAEAKIYVEEAIRRWEPRVTIRSIAIETGERNELLIDIDYYIIEENSVDNLVYPFYLSGAE